MCCTPKINSNVTLRSSEHKTKFTYKNHYLFRKKRFKVEIDWKEKNKNIKDKMTVGNAFFILKKNTFIQCNRFSFAYNLRCAIVFAINLYILRYNDTSTPLLLFLFTPFYAFHTLTTSSNGKQQQYEVSSISNSK